MKLTFFLEDTAHKRETGSIIKFTCPYPEDKQDNFLEKDGYLRK